MKDNWPVHIMYFSFWFHAAPEIISDLNHVMCLILSKMKHPYTSVILLLVVFMGTADYLSLNVVRKV